MDAEIEYANMCAICPCRKRRLEGEDTVEPEKKRKQIESEEEKMDGPAEDNKETDKEDEDSKSEVSLVIAEIDSDEAPDEDDPREVEEEEDEKRETVEGWVPGPEPPECCCVEPLAAIKQTFQEWFAYNVERKAILETQRVTYKVARANCMTHRYLHFIFISWNFPLF